MTDSSYASTGSVQTNLKPLQPTMRIYNSTAEHFEPARSRKLHKKSRFGCFCCKRRRVKCDETRPACLVCRRRNLVCSFVSDQSNELPKSEPVRSTAGYRVILPSIARDLDTNRLESSMIQSQLASKNEFKIYPQMTFNANELMLLKHFALNTGPTIGDSQVQKVYGTIVPQLAVDHPYLMHAILALSFLHTKYLSSTGPNPTTSSKYARYHWQQCLLLYNSKVAPRITGPEADAMLITSTLINGIAFALVNDTCHENSWPFSDHTDDLLWLRIQAGINLIFRATFPLEPSSKIKHIFGDMDGQSYSPPNLADLLNLAPHFCRLCDVTENSTSSNNPYLDTLQLLVSLTQIPCSPKTVFIHLSFIGSARQEFIALLHCKDHNALLILCYWYANLCAYDCWWIAIRSKMECAAICMYLERYASEAIVSLLEIPAGACGVSLKHRRTVREDAEELEPQTLIPCAAM